MDKKNLELILKNNRPNLSEGSLKTYSSLILNFMKENNIKNIRYLLENYNEVYDILKNYNPIKRKTILSSLIVLLQKFKDNDKAINKYKNEMLVDIKNTNNELDKNEKTDKQQDNWIDYEEFKKKYEELKNETKHLFKKDKLTIKEFQKLQDYIIISLYYYMKPRRLLDWINVKVIPPYNKEEDNYFINDYKKIVFNKYKTSKFYGPQVLDVPLNLKKIIKDWLKINNNEYLLVNNKNNKMSNVLLNQRLNKIFDNKNISVNILRHSYISSIYPESMPTNEELKNISKEMGHNLNMNLLYRKK